MSDYEQHFFDVLNSIKSVEVRPKSTEVEADMSKAPVSLRNLFTHSDVHPVLLDLALLKAFGVEWFRWEIETLYSEIQRTFGMAVSEHNRAKIQAVRACHLSTEVWDHWQVFEKLAQVFSGDLPDFEFMQAPNIDQLYVAVDTINMIRKEEWSEEVKRYMAASALFDNVLFTPPPLDFLLPYISQPYYECLDCGNRQEAIDSDGLCDVCTRRFAPEQGFSFKPEPEMLALGRGKNTVLKFKYEAPEVAQKWHEVESLPVSKVDLEENEVDIQVAKLLVAREMMLDKRKELSEQITALKSWLGAA